MSSHPTNPNVSVYAYDYSPVHYRSLGTMTAAPNAPMKVLNPNDGPMRTFLNGYAQGLLNPNQNLACLLGQQYYTIGTGYGQDPVNLYTTRCCSGNVGENQGCVANVGARNLPTKVSFGLCGGN